MFVINKIIALSSLLIVGTSYLYIGWISKKRLSRIGKLNAIALVDLVKIVQEGLGNIRDIILDKSQKHYLNIYHGIDNPRRKRIAQSIFITSYPKSSIEAIGLIFISYSNCSYNSRQKFCINHYNFRNISNSFSKNNSIASTSIYFLTAIEVYRANVQKVLDKLNLPVPNKFINSVETPLKLKINLFEKYFF